VFREMHYISEQAVTLADYRAGLRLLALRALVVIKLSVQGSTIVLRRKPIAKFYS
jgi:hypothetical protein